ncbi:replication protein P [Salinispirillum sp. LH 10-3-1]|uniref:Replication protein P n=1 Tax=Salinispirillum sp. LH 10-3-1 TaxID=2952525 RepID=A0AB38YI50_9GAMM
MNELLANASSNYGNDSATSATSTGSRALDHDVKIMVNMLFARLHHIYTHKFESAYGDEDTMKYAKREWAMVLADFPLRAVELTIDAIRERYSWPPTIAEFLATLSEVARPADLPDDREAYRQACFCGNNPLEHFWSHPAVYHAAHKTGFFRLRTEPEAQVWPIFRQHYQALALRLCKGEQLEVPDIPALPEPPDTGPRFDIPAFAAQHDVKPEAITHLFHYLDLPLGSTVRRTFRARALVAFEQQGIDANAIPE